MSRRVSFESRKCRRTALRMGKDACKTVLTICGCIFLTLTVYLSVTRFPEGKLREQSAEEMPVAKHKKFPDEVDPRIMSLGWRHVLNENRNRIDIEQILRARTVPVAWTPRNYSLPIPREEVLIFELNMIGCPNTALSKDQELNWVGMGIRGRLGDMLNYCRLCALNRATGASLMQREVCCGFAQECPSSLVCNDVTDAFLMRVMEDERILGYDISLSHSNNDARTPAQAYIKRLFFLREIGRNFRTSPVSDELADLQLSSHSMPGRATDWRTYFGPIFVVHLDGTFDSSARLNQLEKELRSVGLWELITIWKSPIVKNGHKGCWYSHKGIAQYAVQHGWDRVLIFEDDVVFKASFKEKSDEILAQAIDFLDGKPSWEVFFFAYNPTSLQRFTTSAQENRSPNSIHNEFVGLRAWSTVAYAIQGAALLRMAKSEWASLPGSSVDGLLNRAEAYGIAPMIATHPPSWSNIENSMREIDWDDKLRNLLSVANSCASLASSYQRHLRVLNNGKDYMDIGQKYKCENKFL